MIEDLVEIFINEFKKDNMRGICVLGSWLFNQYIPNSKIIKGFLIRKNKIYDIGNMYNMRTMPMTHLLGLPQYAIEEPIHLENKADNHKEFLFTVKTF